MQDSLIPFHQQADYVGTFVIDERARDDERGAAAEPTEGPSENAD